MRTDLPLCKHFTCHVGHALLSFVGLLSTFPAEELVTSPTFHFFPNGLIVRFLGNFSKPFVAMRTSTTIGILLTKLFQHETIVFFVHIAGDIGCHFLVGDGQFASCS